MIATLKFQQVDLWDAWVDLESTNSFANLYVIGSVYTNSRLVTPYLVKREQKNIHVLQLEICPSVCDEGGYETEVMYAEELDNLSQYSSIEIFAGEALVAQITDIETFC